MPPIRRVVYGALAVATTLGIGGPACAIEPVWSKRNWLLAVYLSGARTALAPAAGGQTNSESEPLVAVELQVLSEHARRWRIRHGRLDARPMDRGERHVLKPLRRTLRARESVCASEVPEVSDIQ